MPLSGDSEESARLQAEVKAASQECMKRELTSFLQAVAPQQPLVLFFDDLHWADVSTIDLLNFLAGKFDVQHILIIVTYRPSDMLLAKHPSRSTSKMLWMSFHQNRVWGSMQMGWAIARKGDHEKGLAMMLKGVTKWRAVGMVAIIPYWHNLIAEIYGYLNKPEEGLTLLSESLDIVNTTDHRSYEPELHRIKGELLLLQGAGASEVEGCYEKALEVARLQLAKSYELRAAISLVRLWQEQNKQEEARQLLSEIYGWFTEGFDTADLKEAKMLLGEIGIVKSVQKPITVVLNWTSLMPKSK